MSWEEKIALNVFDARHIAKSLLDWFKSNQVDALAWASEGTNETIKPVKHFFINPRIVTDFPAFSIGDISTFFQPGDEVDIVTLEVSYEVGLKDGDIDRMARQIPIYELAFSSMIRNLPKTSLQKDSKIEFDSGSLVGISTDYRALENERGGVFVNIFRTTITWELDYQNRE